MKIRSEYRIIVDCIESGVNYGYMRAYKHTDTPTEEEVKLAISDAVLNEIAEMFSFNNDEGE